MHLGPLRIVQVVLSVVLQPGLPSITWELTRNANSAPLRSTTAEAGGETQPPKGLQFRFKFESHWFGD
jgi:hypothetical protein